MCALISDCHPTPRWHFQNIPLRMTFCLFLLILFQGVCADPYAIENQDDNIDFKKFHAIIKYYENEIKENPDDVKLITAIAWT